MNIEYIVFIVWTITNLCECVYQPTAVEKLLDHIFDHQSYNLMVRPESNKTTGETVIFTELKVLQIDLTWVDERFVWDKSQFDNITDIILPVSKIWVPDIVLQNGVAKNEYLYDMKQFNPWISHTGLITWVPEIRIHTKCTIQVSDFPFDTQRCEISFYSWAHTIKQMKILQFENKNITNTTHLNQNTEWNIFHTCAFNKTIVTSMHLEWWTTSYVLFIKRRNYYHMFNLIIPYFILTLCSVNLFLLPPETGEKISLAVSLLLTYFLNLAILTNYVPESSNELPIIASYYLFNICLISASLGASVCVLNLYFRSDLDSKVPRWLKIILFMGDDKKSTKNNFIIKNNTAKRLSTNHINFNSNSASTKPLKINESLSFNSINEENSTEKILFLKHQRLKGQLSLDAQLLNPLRMPHDKLSSSSSIPIKIQTAQHPKSMEKFTRQLSENILNLFVDLIEGIEKKHDDVIMKRKLNAAKLNDDSSSQSNAHGNSEWREVGRRVDRFLFVISTCVVLASQIFFFWKFYNKNLLPKCNACECESSN